MNRFFIEDDPAPCAVSHCDKHVVKMIVEEGQMLSTAHRLLDGTLIRRPSKSGKTMAKYWFLDDTISESVFYRAVHMGHPCTKWAMETDSNYRWAYQLFMELCREYQHRYGKVHMTEKKLWIALRKPPKNIPTGPLTPMPLAMGSNPECINHDDVLGSYRHYYATKKDRFNMVWTNRDEPKWWNEYVAMV
jgi:hypothetical protein